MRPAPATQAKRLASSMLGGLLCSCCWKLLAKPEQIEYEEWKQAAPCWCTACTPSQVPTRLLLSIHGDVLGNVQHEIGRTG